MVRFFFRVFFFGHEVFFFFFYDGGEKKNSPSLFFSFSHDLSFRLHENPSLFNRRGAQGGMHGSGCVLGNLSFFFFGFFFSQKKSRGREEQKNSLFSLSCFKKKNVVCPKKRTRINKTLSSLLPLPPSTFSRAAFKQGAPTNRLSPTPRTPPNYRQQTDQNQLVSFKRSFKKSDFFWWEYARN